MSEMNRPSRGVKTFWLLARILLWMVKRRTSRFPFSVNLDQEDGQVLRHWWDRQMDRGQTDRQVQTGDNQVGGATDCGGFSTVR